ncbi:MAG: hypothetical protein A2Y72_03360 [Chloroflexi bacterium RBG_13_53_26]|nr:MAG: hypothetical protein A2Y72_03360 [Chloroflexi bacterium RBG_13_53_26]
MRNVPAIQEVCEEIERSNCEITAENLDIAIGRTRMPIAKSTFCPLCNKSLLNNKQRQDHLIVEFAKIAGLLALRAARRSKGGVWV